MSSQSGRHQLAGFKRASIVRIPPPLLVCCPVCASPGQRPAHNQRRRVAMRDHGCCSWQSKNATPSPQIHTTVRPSPQHFPQHVASHCWDRNTWVSLPYAYNTPPLCCALHAHGQTAIRACPLCGGGRHVFSGALAGGWVLSAGVACLLDRVLA